MLKRLTAYCLVLFIFTGMIVISSQAEEAKVDPASLYGCQGIDAQKPYLGETQLLENTPSAFLYETKSRSLMYAWNADAAQYPASFVKLMTALLVLEHGGLDTVVTVSQSALDAVSSDAISAGLTVGEQMSVENLMYCMLVRSANDAAAVLAEYVSGSQDAFVAKMNARAAELGCTGTHFVNAHGLHDDEQVTTARDTCRIIEAALSYELFRTVFGTVHYTVPATNLSEERSLSTNNYLMNAKNSDNVGIYYDDRVTGGRTGVTADGFRSVASLAADGNMEVICIVMGCASTLAENSTAVEVFGGYPETISLLNQAFNGNTRRQVIFENQILMQKPVLNGDSDVFLTTPVNISTVLPKDCDLKQLTFSFSEISGGLQAPIEKGQNLGSLQVMLSSKCIAYTDVFAANDVPVAYAKTGSYLASKKHSISWGWIVAGIVVAIVIGFVIIKAVASKKSVRGKHNKRRR